MRWLDWNCPEALSHSWWIGKLVLRSSTGWVSQFSVILTSSVSRSFGLFLSRDRAHTDFFYFFLIKDLFSPWKSSHPTSLHWKKGVLYIWRLQTPPEILHGLVDDHWWTSAYPLTRVVHLIVRVKFLRNVFSTQIQNNDYQSLQKQKTLRKVILKNTFPRDRTYFLQPIFEWSCDLQVIFRNLRNRKNRCH